MPIVIVCPECQARLNVQEEHAGREAKCPRCQGMIQVPATNVVQAAPPHPPAHRDFAELEDENERPARRRRPREDDYDADEPVRRLDPHRGGLILTLGIISLVACGPVGIAAWAMGSSDLQAMRRGTMDPEGRGNTQVGYVLGIVACAFLALGALIFCGMFALIAGMGLK